MSDDTTCEGTDRFVKRPLSRRTLLKAGAAAGAGLVVLASPLGARGVALARYSQRLAGQPLDTTQPLTLRFMTRSGPGKRAFFKAAGDAFTKLHPNVTIHYEPHVDDWYTKLQVEIAGGAPPDLVFSSDDQMASLAVRGWRAGPQSARNLYPTPRTVATRSPKGPSFLRRRTTWVSTVRWKPSYSRPQMRCSRYSRL